MAESFYPFVEGQGTPEDAVRFAARIAVYDDAAAAPRVVMVQPQAIRSYLEEITATTDRLAREQGGRIPFMVIREIVENLIHAYFAEPIVSILDAGNTIRFADQGPGIADKARALEYGTTSATDEMKRYIRGVGSGLPYVQQYLLDKGGSLDIDDNMGRGTVVTISLAHRQTMPENISQHEAAPQPAGPTLPAPTQAPTATLYPTVPPAQMPAPAQYPYYQPTAYPASPGYGAYQQYQQVAPLGYVPTNPYQSAPGPVGGAALPQQPYAAVPPVSQVGGTDSAEQASPVSKRGRLALAYLAQHESVGPTELANTYGSSQSTWTRELKALEDRGLVTKRGGQKRFLTPAGRAALG